MNTQDVARIIESAPVTQDNIGRPGSYGGTKRRDIEHVWTIGRGEGEHGAPGTIEISLTTRHNSSRGYLYGMVSVNFAEDRKEGGHFAVTLTMPLSRGHNVQAGPTQQIARYSAKAHREYDAHVLTVVQELALSVANQLSEGIKSYKPQEVAAV